MSDNDLSYSIDQDGILRSRLSGPLTQERFDELQAYVEARARDVQTLEGAMGSLRAVVDLSHVTDYHPSVLGLLTQYCKNAKGHFERVATFGANAVVAAARDLALQRADWHDVRHFDTEAEALAWVREGMHT